MVKQLKYGEHEDQHIDIYQNENQKSEAWIVLVHGGYWRERFDKTLMDAYVDSFIGFGFSVINVEYRRGQSHEWPIPKEDVALALQQFKQSEFKPKQLIGIGHSVGGQLVLLNHELLDHVVGLAPVTDVLYTLHHHLGRDAAAEYFNPASTHVLKDASPIMQTPIETDTLIIHGYNDTSVHIDTTLSYVQENHKQGTSVTLYALPYLDHLDCINPEAIHHPMLIDWINQRA
ncbi:alpha/beta hydrolase [Staphylococcus canis]|uniref:Alpha/beta hydrolase n=1 Tax=Staphylococcus canis TaxID=2724942 RepID=A0ABS0T5U4_9STAP|nr:alpha/beta hydrolase [Staphylococcus canis]MBI5974117.1 alpha/beta hydrolase [Staphylococcus canis]